MTSSSSPDVLAEQLKAIRDRELIPTPDDDHADYAILTRCIEALVSSPRTAIPAPADGQVARLTNALARANENHEKFERLWYLEKDNVDRLKLAICGGEDVPGAINAVSVEDCERFIREERMNAYSPADQSSDVSGLVAELREELKIAISPQWHPQLASRVDSILSRLEAKRDGGAG